METVIRYANNQDIEFLTNFLERANVGIEGIKDAIDYFLIMENEFGDIRGTLGIEPWGKVGLLRSLVLAPKSTDKDILVLFEQILKLAKEKDLTSLYLATNKMASVQFFKLLGFEEEEKSELPEILFQSEHVRQIRSVDNSVFLKLSL